MASGSPMAAVNVSDSRDSSLTPPPQERNTTGKSTQRRTREGGHAKNLAPLPPAANKRTADQAFHDASMELVPDSQLQNEVANLERQVLEAKKSSIVETTTDTSCCQPSITYRRTDCQSKRDKDIKLWVVYKHESEESHLFPFMRKYRLVNIQYIRNIKKNKFKPENIMKLSSSVRRTREVAKSLKIGTSSLEIEAKEEDCTNTDTKSIIPLL